MSDLRYFHNLPDLMTREELAQFLQLEVVTLANWAAQLPEHKGPKVTKLGSRVRYRKSDLEKWLRRNDEPAQ